MSLYTIIYIDDGYNFEDVKNTLEYNIQVYLTNLRPGDDLIYSQIEKTIMNTAGVYKVTNTQIKINGGTWVTNNEQSNIKIARDEYTLLDTLTYYDGVQVVQG
jgi:uncharacterized phage protein gp47/JayE